MVALLELLDFMVFLLAVAFVARPIMGWMLVNHEHENPPLVRLLDAITEPILKPLRRVVPQGMLFDITPFVAFLLILLIQSATTSILLDRVR